MKKSNSCAHGRPSIKFTGSQSKHIDTTTEDKKDTQILSDSKRIKEEPLRTLNKYNSSKTAEPAERLSSIALNSKFTSLLIMDN